MTRTFDVGVTAAAAAAAAAAGAHAAGDFLTIDILHAALVGGAVKAGAMAFAGLLSFGPLNNAAIAVPLLLGSTFATNALVVTVVSNRMLGNGMRYPLIDSSYLTLSSSK